MLVPAQLYRDELKNKLIAAWYDPKYKYYFSGSAYELSLPNNNESRHDFVHLDTDGKVDGYFSYQIDWQAKSLYNFGLVGFKDKNADFIRDCLVDINKMISNGIKRCEFWAWEDNERANRLYRRLIEEYGGQIVGHLHKSGFFGGEYHDTVIYEILF